MDLIHDRREPTEESALLPKQRRTRRKTPLPIGQLGVLMLGQLAEPVSATCILPFLNQMIEGFDITGGDPSKVGYYVGLMVSLFFMTEAMTVLHWSRLSDRIGRKPVLLIGLFGLTISMLFVGLSKSFWALVLSRMLCGALNGNTGVTKSAMGEITDSTNVAQAFALMPITWSVGVTIAPFMGGQLQRPAQRFPQYFDTPFWRTYPYFLPCLVAGAFSFVCLVTTFFCFEETLPTDHYPRPSLTRTATASTSSTISTLVCPPSPGSSIDSSKEALGNLTLQNIATGNPIGAPLLLPGEPGLYPDVTPPTRPSSDHEGPMPLKELLKCPGVMVSIVNYGLLAILDIAYAALNPLVLASPVVLGGLGLDPPTIGLVMGAWGILNGAFQGLFFTRVLERFGPRRTFVGGIMHFVPIFVCFGLSNAVARLTRFGEEDARPGAWLVWAVVILQMVMVTFMDVSFGTIMIYIRAASPNTRSLGATNGIAQLVASVVRAIGPATATSMYAFSVGHKLLGGYAVYAVLIATTLFAIQFALKLPQNLDDDDES